MSTPVCHQTAMVVTALFSGKYQQVLPPYTSAVPARVLQQEIVADELDSEKLSTGVWLITLWQFTSGQKPFYPHSFIIERNRGLLLDQPPTAFQYRAWMSFANAYSGGYTLNGWLEVMPWWGWSEFAGSKILSREEMRTFFGLLTLSESSSNTPAERIKANWNLFRPDSLQGYTAAYLGNFGNDTEYRWSAVRFEGLSGSDCLRNRPVVEQLRKRCFENTPCGNAGCFLCPQT